MEFNVFGKDIYIAKKIGTKQDEYGNDYAIYSKPRKYHLNVQPVVGRYGSSSSTDINPYGLTTTAMQRIILPRAKYENVFHEGDVAYLDGAKPKGELEYGDNANYYINGSPLNQNLLVVIYLEKRINK